MAMSSQGKEYEYLEHTADIKYLAYGKNLEEVFENAALAMFNVIIDTQQVSGETPREVFLKSPDRGGSTCGLAFRASIYL